MRFRPREGRGLHHDPGYQAATNRLFPTPRGARVASANAHIHSARSLYKQTNHIVMIPRV